MAKASTKALRVKTSMGWISRSRITDSQKFCPRFSADTISLKVLSIFSGLENSVDPGSKALAGKPKFAGRAVNPGRSIFLFFICSQNPRKW